MVHLFLVTVVLSCILHVPVHVNADRFYYQNFQNRPYLNLNGDAASAFGKLSLTRASKNQAGAVWYSEKVNLEYGFKSWFEFSITKIENDGESGFAFVIQSDGPYALGEGGPGLGYSGLKSGLAVEFDTHQDQAKVDPGVPHISVHQNLHPFSNSETSLTSIESQDTNGNNHILKVENLLKYFEESKNEVTTAFQFNIIRPRRVYVNYDPTEGVIEVMLQRDDREKSGGYYSMINHRVSVGQIKGNFYVGFTASTAESYAEFNIHSWSFKTVNSDKTLETPCSQGFSGPACSVTNEEASKECPRRKSCNVCVEDVYNCAWCIEKKTGKQACVVGTLESTRTCETIAVEPATCAMVLSHVWLYSIFGAILILIAFGVLVIKCLPAIQSFRALSLIIATIGGALFGMAISFVVSVSLVEISETNLFAIAYGIFFILCSGIIIHHILTREMQKRPPRPGHLILLWTSAIWIAISGILCFVLDKRWVHWLPEGLKVLFYVILGAALNFTLVFSCVDIVNSCWAEVEKYRKASWRRRYEPVDAEAAPSLTSSAQRIIILAFSSVLCGMFFGFMFGQLRIEEEASYR